MPDTPPTLEELAAEPQSTSVDGQSVTNRSADDVLKLRNAAAAEAAVAGTNANGGPVSMWSRLRPARAVPPGAV